MARQICGLSNATVVSVYEYLNKYSTGGRIEMGHERVADMLPDTNNDYYNKYKVVNIHNGLVHLTFDKEQSVVYVEEYCQPAGNGPDAAAVGVGIFWVLDCTDIPEWIDGPDEDDLVAVYDGSMDK